MSNQVNSLRIGDAEIQAIPYSQINETTSDYTGIISVCGILLIITITFFLFSHYWINKFYKHKENIDNKKVENELYYIQDIIRELNKVSSNQKEIINKLSGNK